MVQAETEIGKRLRRYLESQGIKSPEWDHSDSNWTGRYFQQDRGLVGPFVLRHCQGMHLPSHRLQRHGDENEQQRFERIVAFFVEGLKPKIARDKEYIAGPYYLEIELEHKPQIWEVIKNVEGKPHIFTKYGEPSQIICDYKADWVWKNRLVIRLRDKAHFQRAYRAWREGLDFTKV